MSSQQTDTDLFQKLKEFFTVDFQIAYKITILLSIIFGLLSFFILPFLFIILDFVVITWFFFQDTSDMDESTVNNKKLLVTAVNFISILMVFVSFGYYILVTEILIFVAFYAIIAMSLNMSTGLVGVLNFGVVAQIAVGAIILGLATVNFGLPIWLGILLGMIGAGLFSGLLALTTLRLRDDYFAIVSITIGEIIRQFLKTEPTLRGPYLKGGGQPTTPGILNIPQPFKTLYDNKIQDTIFDVIPYRLSIAIVGILFLLFILIISDLIIYSPYGRVLRTIREDELVTSTYGKHLFRYKVEVMMISGAIAGLGGAIYAWIFASLFPEHFLPIVTFFVWTVFIIGGRGNNKGMIIGAMVFVLLERLSLFFNSPDLFIIKWLNYFVKFLYRSINLEDHAPGAQMAYLQLMIVGIVLILFIRFAPKGLIPEEAYRPNIKGFSLPPPGSQSGDPERIARGD